MKYVENNSTHTPSTLRAILSGFLNQVAKLITRKPSFHLDGIDKIYPNHANAILKAGLASPNFPSMGDVWSKQDERVDTKKEQDIIKKDI